jgi:DNA-binding winged helix-turn-helix (wHTH) protein
MAEAHQLRGQIRFGVFELDLRSGELRKRGLRVRLQEQPFRVFEMLLQHSGEVVTREELQKSIWPGDTFVDFYHGLNKAINKIREALGDSAESPRFVETVSRRGYRFLAEVKDAEAAPVGGREVAIQPQLPAEAPNRRNLPAKVAEIKNLSRSGAWKISMLLLLLMVALLAIRNFLRGTARPLSFAPWLFFRSKASQTTLPRITSLTG